MWKLLTNWWNKDKIEMQRSIADMREAFEFMNSNAEATARTLAAEAAAREAKLAHELAEAKQIAEEQARELADKKAADEAEEAKRNGSEPWVEIRSADYSDVKGVQIELDWNDAFIQYLKDSGMSGSDDETLVQKWLALLNHDLIGRLEQVSINKSDRKTINDFE